MAYADQQPMSTNRVIAIILVVALHAGLGFALVSGLAYNAFQKVKEKMEVIQIDEEKPPEEEPPPPDEVIIAPPPSFALDLNIKNDNKSELAKEDTTKKEEVKEAYKTCQDGSRVLESATCAQKDEDRLCSDGKTSVKASVFPSGCPAVPNKARGAKPKNNPGSWATTNDYPSRALSQEREGTTTFRVTVGPDGKVADCQVTGSSGHGDLDAATCSNVKRRARFDPALDASGSQTSGSYSNRVTWRIPKE